MTTPALLVDLFDPWSQIFSDSRLVATLVVFGHIAAMLLAGGLAITLDRATLRAFRASEMRTRQLADLSTAHRVVVTGLAMSVVTGVMLFASDVETYFVSGIYWTKMALVVALLANGWNMTRVEAALSKSPSDADAGWKQLRIAATVSLVLWFAIAFAGVALVNAA